MKTKIFCDSADFKTIKKLNGNSSSKWFHHKSKFDEISLGLKITKSYSLKLLNICKTKPISLEVFADTR